MWDLTLTVIVATAALAVAAAGVLLTALQLPGNWLIVLVGGLYAWWGWADAPEAREVGWWALAAVLALAVVGEVLEGLTGALGSRAAGGSRRAALLAIVGGVIGAIVGTAVIPILIVGTLIGAAVGAAAGSLVGDLWKGRDIGPALGAARGAAIGKITGTVLKLAIGAAMWLVLALAVVF